MGRTRGCPAYPYVALDQAVALVGVTADAPDRSRAAAAAGVEPASWTFRQCVAAARLFGLLEGSRHGRWRLTDRGAALAENPQDPPLLAAAFLQVPLYRAVDAALPAGEMPSRPAVIAELERHGVSPAGAARCASTFRRSAGAAGMFGTFLGASHIGAAGRRRTLHHDASTRLQAA